MKKAINLLLVICMLVSLSACGQTSILGINKRRSPEAVAGEFVLALYTNNPEKIIDCIPSFILNQLARTYRLPVDDIEGLIDAMKSDVREPNIPQCVITNAYRDDASSVLAEYVNNLDSYGVTNEDMSVIDEYCMVNVEVMVNGENRNNIVFCIKYDGEWCAVDID